MRRQDKAITDPQEIEALIHQATICRLAITDDHQPYIIPLCFGYAQNTLYFHAATAGKKIDLLKKNPQVCFEMDFDTRVILNPHACMCGMTY